MLVITSVTAIIDAYKSSVLPLIIHLCIQNWALLTMPIDTVNFYYNNGERLQQ